jgi:hypothetical protein
VGSITWIQSMLFTSEKCGAEREFLRERLGGEYL